ncbi:MAG: outer membrane protein assembly factor BamC [Pseudomonadota bacterium]|nr:outer membrane protein assembly factor BamC [Pseudomonadota bacterium]
MERRLPLALLGTTAALLLGACSVLESDKIDYKSAGQGVSLEVPPDLTQLPGQSRYTVTGGAVTASGYQAGQATTTSAGAPVAANTVADVQFIREGSQRWLHVARTPEQLWSPVRDFWLESGFLLSLDQANLGLMETDWAENRAKIPQDIIRRTIGKAFDSLYSTGERDRFRTRLELNPNGGTDIYITHRGMEEVYSTAQRDSTIWRPRASDPELEAEFLRRLMVKLGASQEQAQAATTAAAAAPGQPQTAAAQLLATDSGAPALQVADEFDRAWRRVGLALDRTGFTVEDRDRTKGIYFVRYIDPKLEKQEPGFFGRLLGRGSQPLPTQQYQITVRSQAQASAITVQDGQGRPAPAADAQRILQVLLDELK